MSLHTYGLALLKIKWPDKRAALDQGFSHSNTLRDMLRDYAEAISYVEKMIREGFPAASVREYEALCDDLEAEARCELVYQAQDKHVAQPSLSL